MESAKQHRAAPRARIGLLLACMTIGPLLGCGEEDVSSMQQILASDIPIAHTPEGGYGDEFPAPILAGCTEPLVNGAPDLRGMWITVAVDVDGAPAPDDHPAYAHFERVEQCGDRLVVTSGGVLHDMRCDGTELNGVHDVAVDLRTPIVVVATYENSVHTLRPVGVPVVVTRRRDGDEMIWAYLTFTARLRRVSPPDALPPMVEHS